MAFPSPAAVTVWTRSDRLGYRGWMRKQWIGLSALVLFSTAIACGGDEAGSGGSGGTASGSSTGGTGGTTSSGGNTGTGGDGGGMGGGYGDICNDAYNDACIDCSQTSCCMELEACTMDADCQDLLDCFLAGTSPPMCLGMVNQSPAVLDVVACASASCGADCT
jgi:hypothetical protein